MLSIALCLFVFNSWATTVQSFSADLAAEHLFFSQLDESQNVKLYWNVDIEKRTFSSLLRRRRPDGSDLASPAVKAKWKEQIYYCNSMGEARTNLR